MPENENGRLVLVKRPFRPRSKQCCFYSLKLHLLWILLLVFDVQAVVGRFQGEGGGGGDDEDGVFDFVNR